MNVDQIKVTLFAAAEVKLGRIDKDAPVLAQVEQVQDHLQETAIWRADLERARLYAYIARDALRDRFDAIHEDAYSAYTGGRVSKAAVEAAKALVDPETHDGLVQATRLIDRLSDQIKRLEIDDKAASRLYTMLTGG